MTACSRHRILSLPLLLGGVLLGAGYGTGELTLPCDRSQCSRNARSAGARLPPRTRNHRPTATCAPRYTLTDLGTLGDVNVEMLDVNESGVVVGHVKSRHGHRAFAWQGGMFTALGAPGGRSSSALSFNSSGVIVGQASTTTEGDIRAVRWIQGRVERLEPLGDRWSCATDINDAGQVVGAVRAPGDGAGCLAYRHDRGVVETLGDLGGAYGWAEAINGRGQVVGWAFTTGHEEHAVLWEDSRPEDLGTLGGADSRARDINDFGEVAGVAATADGRRHAFLWRGGAMEDLGTLGGEASDALAINDRGQIVGQAEAAEGDGRAFLYSEVTGMLDLNECLVDRDVLLIKATGISDAGVIIGWGVREGRLRAVRLTPLLPGDIGRSAAHRRRLRSIQSRIPG